MAKFSYMDALYAKRNRERSTMKIVITATLIALAISILATVGGFAYYLIFDNNKDNPPKITPVDSNTVLYVGDTVSYRNLVTVTDDSGKDCTLKFDASAVNLNKAGEYVVKYTATDKAGNSTTYELTITVKDGTYTEKKLMEHIDSIAKKTVGFTKEEAKGKTKVEIVKAIYNFVNSPGKGKYEANIYFNDTSNTPRQEQQGGQQSRTHWKDDWVEEATITLSMSRMQGDCYSYYAVSKAFFEYYGIENCGVQRNSTKSELSGTHYWNIVKVEGGWYYFDATRLAGTFEDGGRNACLITESKLKGYKTSEGNPYFYKMNKTDTDFYEASANGGKLPQIETKAIG